MRMGRRVVAFLGCLVAAVAAQWISAGVRAAAYRGDGWFRIASAPTQTRPSDVAGLPDGSVVVAYQGDQTWRYIGDVWVPVPRLGARGLATDPAGKLLATLPYSNAVVAWRPGWTQPERLAGGRGGFGGDGGSALLARLSLSGIDGSGTLGAQADGSILIADTGNHRVRRVDPNGVITTVAGTGRSGVSGDGGPAAAARLREPEAVATLPDGGYLIADPGGGRLRRVGPDGVISTLLARRDSPYDVAVAGGEIVIADGDLWRIGAAGGVERVGMADFALRGDSEDGCAQAIGTNADGGLYAVGCGLWYRPATQPAKPLVALRASRVSRRDAEVVLESTHPGTAVLQVWRNRAIVLSAEQQIAPGHARLAGRGVLWDDGWYRVRLSVITSAGNAHDSIWLYRVDRLSIPTARRLMNKSGSVRGGEGDLGWWLGKRCRAFGRRRVDCEVRQNYAADDFDTCDSIASLRIGASGLPVVRHHSCGRKSRALFKRRPRWHHDQEVLPP